MANLAKSSLVICLLALSAAPALAEAPASGPAKPDEKPPVDAGRQALVQMIQEGTSREATALARAYELAAEVAGLRRRLTAESVRADQAEAKIPKPEAATP